MASRCGWERWHRHVLGVIEQAAAAYPGQRIGVSVGVEHAYGLRQRLAGVPGIRRRDTAALLAPAFTRPD